MWYNSALIISRICTCISISLKVGREEVNIYVGNIAYGTGEDDLRDLFTRYGEVSAVRVITDRDTGRSKGFGFVEMADDDKAKEAIAALDSNDFMGRDLRVNEARPREPR